MNPTYGQADARACRRQLRTCFVIVFARGKARAAGQEASPVNEHRKIRGHEPSAAGRKLPPESEEAASMSGGSTGPADRVGANVARCPSNMGP